MAYERQTWINNKTVLTAEMMEHIENGIVSLHEAVQCTDVITYTNENGTGDVIAAYNMYIDASGAEQATGAWRATDYIPLIGNVTITGKFVNNSNIAAAAFYDADKVFISSMHADSTSLNFDFNIDTAPPDGAAYVRFSFIAEGNAGQYATVTSVYDTEFATKQHLEDAKGEFVTYTVNKNRSEAEKAQARRNIDAAKEETVTVVTRYTLSGEGGDVELAANGRINAEGVFEATGTFATSDYIAIDSRSVIDGGMYESNSSYSLSFYDSEKAFISGIGFQVNWGGLQGPFDIPANAAYVRITFMSANSGAYCVVTTVEPVTDTFAETELSYEAIVEASPSGAYVNSSGVAESTAAWAISPYTRVNSSHRISYKLYGTASTSLLAFYDRNLKFISSITVSEAGLHDGSDVIPPDGAYYVRYAIFLGQTSQYVRFRYQKIETAIAEIERMQAENPLQGKILAATGDSITATVSYRQYAGYAKIIAERNLMTYESKAIWGATIASGIEGSSGCILETIPTMREDADYIILSGGANDFYALSGGREQLGAISSGYAAALDTTTFCGALESMLKQAIERWPGKKILYVITHRMLDIGHADLQNWVSMLIEILEKWGIPYVDLWHDMPSLMLGVLKNPYTSMGNTEYSGTGDGLHPNEEGYRLYYVPRIESRLKAI